MAGDDVEYEDQRIFVGADPAGPGWGGQRYPWLSVFVSDFNAEFESYYMNVRTDMCWANRETGTGRMIECGTKVREDNTLGLCATCKKKLIGNRRLVDEQI